MLAQRDKDAFDKICDHLLVVDHAAKPTMSGKQPVVGTYRLLRQDVAAWKTLLAAMVEDDARTIDRLPLLTRDERHVVLDECHQLLSLWGYLVRAVLAALGDDVHVVGLTATSPDELTGEEAELYTGLLGEVDFQVPTPAVVKKSFEKYIAADYIDSVRASDLNVTREGNAIVAQVAWQKQLHMVGNVSLLLDFDVSVSR